MPEINRVTVFNGSPHLFLLKCNKLNQKRYQYNPLSSFYTFLLTSNNA